KDMEDGKFVTVPGEYKADKSNILKFEVIEDKVVELTAENVGTKEGVIAGTLYVKVDFPSNIKAVKLVEVDGIALSKDMEDGKFVTVPGEFKAGQNEFKFEIEGQEFSISK
uniref:hypothetical protein n=1 Tax=Anaerophilus nitritogenes TaxID=2498136 RepID=UPI0013EC3EEE